MVFLRHLSYCRRKAFNNDYDKINKFSNFKCNLVSRSNKLEDTYIELASDDTFLRTWDSLLNLIEALINNLIDSFISVMLQSNAKIQIFRLVNIANHSGLHLSNVLHKQIIHFKPAFCIWIISSLHVWIKII